MDPAIQKLIDDAVAKERARAQMLMVDAEAATEEQRQRFKEVKQRLEEEQQRLEEAKQRLEEEKQRLEEEKQRLEEEKQKTRPTTLDEFLGLCHDSIFSRLSVQTNRSLTSLGSMASPKNKPCPNRLAPWDSFLDEQMTALHPVLDRLAAQRQFLNPTFLAGLGDMVARPVASERGLEWFQQKAVEYPTETVVRCLSQGEAMPELDVGLGVVFENNPHALSVVPDENVPSPRRPGVPPRTPQPQRHRQPSPELKPPNRDQICVYRCPDAKDADTTKRVVAYVMEYKAPHKLTLPQLRVGLRAMSIGNDVVNRTTTTIPTEGHALFEYNAVRLVVAALVQIYEYMLECGLEYGLLTTGQAYVFLKIDWANAADTLYYHLSEPAAEVEARRVRGLDDWRYCTALGQLVGFTAMALGPRGALRHHIHMQDESCAVFQRLSTWIEDYEVMLRKIPEAHRKPPPDSPAFVPKTYVDVDCNPRRYNLRSKEVFQVLSTQSPAEGDDDDDDDWKSRPYCTQACLLGLQTGGDVDPNCPNVASHRQTGQDSRQSGPKGGCKGGCKGRENGPGRSHRHVLSHKAFLELLFAQLERTLDRGIAPLDKEGGRGVLFRVVLLSHGYTFVAKGTVSGYASYLEHEEAVYQQLQAGQGVYVPVCLGSVDLRWYGRVYYYCPGVRIVHLLFLSWGGQSPREAGVARDVLRQQTVRSVRQMHQHGVLHRDIRIENVLWRAESQRIVVIDFEQALLASVDAVAEWALVDEDEEQKAEIKLGSGSEPDSLEALGRRTRLMDIASARWIA